MKALREIISSLEDPATKGFNKYIQSYYIITPQRRNQKGRKSHKDFEDKAELFKVEGDS